MAEPADASITSAIIEFDDLVTEARVGSITPPPHAPTLTIRSFADLADIKDPGCLLPSEAARLDAIFQALSTVATDQSDINLGNINLNLLPLNGRPLVQEFADRLTRQPSLKSIKLSGALV